jgi:carboxyl-terminal processing protease
MNVEAFNQIASPPLSGSAAWQRVWQDFENQYSYFEHKGVNWKAVFAEHKDSFDGLAPDAFAEKLNNVLQVLHDWHVAVRKPDGTLIGYQRPFTDNGPPRLYSSYVSSAGYQSLKKGSNVVIHGLVTTNIAHVIITTLETGAFAAITDQDIEDLFSLYQDASAMILDLRYNTGGNENNALKFAGRFTDATETYGYFKVRQPNSAPYEFGPLTPKRVTPSAGTHFRGPVIGLIGQRCVSSAEWFTLMLKVCPNAILIGDTTRGASANPISVSFPELNISYTISRWIAYDEKQSPFEDRGIKPAIEVPARESFDDSLGRDYVLERAIDYVRWRQAFDTGSQPIATSGDYDDDGLSNLSEYWAGTNPARAESGLNLRVALSPIGNGIELSWKSVAGKRYTMLVSDKPSGQFSVFSNSIAATAPLNVLLMPMEPGANARFYKLELLTN